MPTRSEHLESFRKLGGQSLIDDILQTEEDYKRADGRFAPASSRPTGNWHIPGVVEEILAFDSGFRLRCEQGWVELKWLAANCLHVRYAHQLAELESYFSYAVQKTDWPVINPDVVDQDDRLIITTSAFVFQVAKHPFHLSVETLEGDIICGDASGIQTRQDGAVQLAIRLRTEEACYGLGERAAHLNLRGNLFSLWNTDPPTVYQRGSDPLYYNIPFYLGVHDGGTYGVLWDNSHRGSVDVGKSTPSELIFEAEAGDVSYYLFAGDDVNAVLSRYTELSGRIVFPPLWFLGYQQCRWSYYPQARVLELAKEFRSREIPCDVIYIDIHYMDGHRVFTWDRERFPEPEQMIRTLHDQGFKIVAIVDPGIKVDPGYATYESGIENDVFVKYPDGALVGAPVWPGLCHFPDFTKPAVRDWWVRQCGPMLNAGIDGLWNDMCEPVTFLANGPGTLPDYVRHDKEGQGSSHLEMHNVYGMQMAHATLQALQTHKPDVRPVNMLRAGYAGTQRYAASWTGDNTSNWDHLRLSISMTLNMGLSGAPMTGSDIGGFAGNADGELFARWVQAACLMPYFRGHSSLDTNPHEPWAFGQPYEVASRMAIELRYRLLPYLYSVVAQAAEYGWPVIRPIFMAEPGNPDLRSIDDCYMLGDIILVAPIVEQGAVSRSVYLPGGTDWYDFWSNESITGGQHIEVAAPLERLPLFVRAGAVLPLWPAMQHVGQKPIDTMTLRFFPGSHETILYEDAGEGRGYQNGEYRWVYITATEEDEKLTLSRRVAGSYEPPYTSISLEVVGLQDEPQDIRVDRQGAPMWFFDNGLLEVRTNAFRSAEITRKPNSSDPTLLSRPW